MLFLWQNVITQLSFWCIRKRCLKRRLEGREPSWHHWPRTNSAVFTMKTLHHSATKQKRIFRTGPCICMFFFTFFESNSTDICFLVWTVLTICVSKYPFCYASWTILTMHTNLFLTESAGRCLVYSILPRNCLSGELGYLLTCSDSRRWRESSFMLKAGADLFLGEGWLPQWVAGKVSYLQSLGTLVPGKVGEGWQACQHHSGIVLKDRDVLSYEYNK